MLLNQNDLTNTKKLDPIVYWVLLSSLAFLLLPSYALDYGLLGSTTEEFYEAYGWLSFDIAWLWFILPLPLLFRNIYASNKKNNSKNKLDSGYVCVCFIILLASAIFCHKGFGYSVILLVFVLGMILTNTLTRLDYFGGDKFVAGSLITIVLLISIFVIYPMICVFIPMFYDGDVFVPHQFIDILSKKYIIRIITNSIFLAISVGTVATFFGLICALYTSRIATKTAVIGRIFSLLPIVTPPFVVGLGVTLMMGKSGYVTEFASQYLGLTQTNWLYGFNGILIAQVLAFAPVSFMILDGAIKTIHPFIEEASYTLRATRYKTFFFIFLPLLRPALANSFLIIFVQSLADFSNPLVLGGSFDVLATQIYFYITGAQLDYASASTLGSILLLLSLLIFVVQYIWVGKRSYVTVSGKFTRGDVQSLPPSLNVMVIGIFYVWLIVNCVLYGSIFYGSFTVNWGVDYTLTLNNFINLFGQGFSDGAWPSLIDSFIFAGVAAPVTAMLGLLIAYIVIRQQFRGKKVIEFSAMLCFALPGTVVGIAYILAFNNAPIYLTGTAMIVIISMIMRNVPVGIRAGIAGLGQLDKSLDEASLSLKAGTFRTIRYILLPLLKPAILSSLVYSFVRAITTVSAIIFLVTPDTRVATAYILNRVEDGEYGIAIAYGSILIVAMLAIILLFDWLVGESKTAKSKAKISI